MMGAALLVSAVLLTGCDQGSSPPEENPGTDVAVAENDSLGAYLVDGDGMSLYLFTDDAGDPVPCTTDDCVAAWPPVTTDGEPSPGDGVDAELLSTTERQDGTTQVVYNGWPLYYFVNDGGPGDVNGQGIVSFGGTWYLITPSGDEVEASSGDGGDDDPPY